MNKKIVLSFISAASPNNLERVVVAMYKRGMTLPAEEASLVGAVVPMDTINAAAARLSAGTDPDSWPEISSSIESFDLDAIKMGLHAVVVRSKALNTNIDNTLLPSLSGEGLTALFAGWTPPTVAEPAEAEEPTNPGCCC